jgi:hypothetical protein
LHPMGALLKPDSLLEGVFGVLDTAIGEEAEEVNTVLRDSYITSIRKSLFKRISPRRGGNTDWSCITGKKNRDKNGKRITLSRHAQTELQKVVDQLNTEEMAEELREIGVTPPDHTEGLIELIRNAKTDRVMKADEFRLFQKHKERILRYLAKSL